jgi:type I restriction enzyme M protein
MAQRITQQQLESYLWGAAVLLRGTIDAGDYKQFIFPLLFYKRLCDVFDEETQTALAESGGDRQFSLFPENHRFQIPPEAHWREVRQVATDVGRALQTALRAIETANPDKLYGIFGDAQWTNKDRLSDAMLRDLVEHFSTLELSIANLPEDELGQGYEYLIKKFADDSGHTAAEFYTNRTVVHLMTEMLQPQPGESIYDPTCGSGGMLLSAIAHLRQRGQEWRNVRLYGQERNLMTSAIARMNCFLHGIEDFRIERGDTLAAPTFVEGDSLMRFDVVLANPPYSIKQWDRDAFASDPWGRNPYGTPPQGRADYAFWQHILQSVAPKTGRCAILFPHGVLFRQEEADMRRKLIEADVIECVLGLGPNLFYNSPMEACVVICRTAKAKERRHKILFINAVNEVSRERAQSFLTDDHIVRIVQAYEAFTDEPGFTRVVGLEGIRARDGNLSIPLYVSAPNSNGQVQISAHDSLSGSLSAWLSSATDVRAALATILGINAFKDTSALDGGPAQTPPAWIKRDEWTRLPFGEFAQSVNERVEPSGAGDEIYVGLEHLDQQDLHIRRWGKGSDVIGTKLRFRKGDLIFGRRRAYQRKLAVAEFDGICSAHAMVVRAKPDVVLPEFLPFLMMSDRFMTRAVEISVGSLSPTINWTTLKLEEFALPPLDQQRRIAEILWAVEESVEAAAANFNLLSSLKQAAMEEYTLCGKQADSNRRQPPRYPTRLLGDVVTKCQYGLSCPLSESGSYPILRMMNYDEELVAATELKYADMPAEVAAEFEVRKGDILFNRTNSADLVGKAGLFNLDGCFLFASYLVRIQTNRSLLLPEFLNYYLNCRHGQAAVRAFVTPGVSQSNISAGSLKKVKVPVPPLREQEALMHKLDDVALAYRTSRAYVATQRSMLKGVINAVLEG